MWACQHPSFHCARGLMRRLQFTVHTESFICQSQQKIRRYQRSPCQSHLILSSSAGWRECKLQGWREERRCLPSADFIPARAVQICKIAFGIRDTILSLMQRPFFLPHTWAKLWMRCYLFTPCWTETCALFICTDRRDSRVGHRPGKTLKGSAQSNKDVARDLRSHADANTVIDFLPISLFSANPQQ